MNERRFTRRLFPPWKKQKKTTITFRGRIAAMYRQIESRNPIEFSCTFLAMVVAMCLVMKVRKRRLKSKASRSILSSTPITIMPDDGRDKAPTALPADGTLAPTRHQETNSNPITMQTLVWDDEPLDVSLLPPEQIDSPNTSLKSEEEEEQTLVLEFENSLFVCDTKPENSILCRRQILSTQAFFLVPCPETPAIR